MNLRHNSSEFVAETHALVKNEILYHKRKICNRKNHA